MFLCHYVTDSTLHVRIELGYNEGLNKHAAQNVIFRPSKVTNFIQNFVQVSNFRPNLVQLPKGCKQDKMCVQFTSPCKEMQHFYRAMLAQSAVMRQ